jgi:hypothetical protein
MVNRKQGRPGRSRSPLTVHLYAFFPSRPGMRLVIDLLEPFDTGMRIDLSCAERRVPEKLLHCPEVGSGIQHVCGKGVPQRMDPEPIHSDPVEHAMYDSLNSARSQSPSEPAHEHRSPIGLGPPNDRLTEIKIAPESKHGPRAYWDNPFLAAFAPDFRLVGQKIEILQIHPTQLREADARRVEQLENGQIASRNKLVSTGPRLRPVE